MATMQLRDFALNIISTESIEKKLAAPPVELTDSEPGPALRIERPGRPPGLRIVKAAQAKGGTGPKLWEVPEGPEPWEDTE